MSIGVSVSGTVDAAKPSNAVDTAVDQAREAADLGLRSVWFGQRFDYDAIGLAAIVGREVPGIEVGTSAVPIFGRHPLLVAGQAQTTQAATHGRFALGLALGAPSFVEAALGVPFERPVARLREFLIVARQVLETGQVDFPRPAITRAAEQAGRPAPRIVACVAGAVTDDVAAAREAAIAQTAFYDRVPSYQRVVALSGAQRVAELVVLGDEDAVAASVRRHFEAGATDVVFTQTNLAGETGRQRTWKLLGELASMDT
ncbi:MAG TPA: LLM class flavin-dependent oxidoreductase [Pseudonocardiaceae bacterium]|nr:LLM class flavin-dependent oxidoreductase [Pseudonocardiaceae bacterium]